MARDTRPLLKKLAKTKRGGLAWIDAFALEVAKGVGHCTVARAFGLSPSTVSEWVERGKSDLAGLGKKDEGGHPHATGDSESVYAKFAAAVVEAEGGSYSALERTLQLAATGKIPTKKHTVVRSTRTYSVCIRQASADQDAVYEEKEDVTVTETTVTSEYYDGQALRFALARRRPEQFGAGRERDEGGGSVSPELYARSVVAVLRAMDETLNVE